jgi:hypothetical protein
MTVIYSFAEVVEITKGVITKDWLDRQARAGTFEHVHVGRNRGLTPAQLDRLLEQQTTKPSAAEPADLPVAEIASLTPRSRGHRMRAAR